MILKESYLNLINIISVVKLIGCDVIYLGYGFLVENVDFVELCCECNLIFIGLSLEVILKMGIKDVVCDIMKEVGVLIVLGL